MARHQDHLHKVVSVDETSGNFLSSDSRDKILSELEESEALKRTQVI